MKTLRNISVLFASLVLTACTSRNVREVDGVLVVDVEDVRDGKDIAIETLAESVESIALETADNAFFEFRKACFSENRIVIMAKNGLVRIFGRDGRFVGLLEGMDERTEVYDIAVDEAQGTVYASTVNSDRLLVFDLAGRRKPDIILQSCANKPVLAADQCGVALAQFDFTDQPSGFNAATIKKSCTSHASRQSLCTSLRNSDGMATGFNHDIFGSRTDGQLHFMASFCDTLFRYDTEANRIVPELAVNLPVRHVQNPCYAMPELALEERWMTITALPCHYIIDISGTDAQRIIVDRRQRTATRATITGIGSLRMHYADGYACTVLPPKGKENSTLVLWKLGNRQGSGTAGRKGSSHKTAPLPGIQQPEAKPVEWDKRAARTALDLSERGNPAAAMQAINKAITQAGVKTGHPALAYAYAVKSALHTQLGQTDSADNCRRLVNAPLTRIQQRDINKAMMKICMALGRYEEAQEYAIAYGVTSDAAQGTKYVLKLAENRDRINGLSQQTEEDSRLLHCLLAALALVATAAAAAVLILRRQKKRQIAATRRELQSRMERRIEILSAAQELSVKATGEMRAEIMKNHALIRRINRTSVTRPLTDGEEDLLHRIAGMLYPGLADRLHAKADTPLNKRELTICYLIRLGVPQLSIGILLDVKAASFRVIKSNLKRDRFRLPVKAELEEFICSL